MTLSGGARAAVLISLLLAGCGGPPALTLPEITMTGQGGFEPSAQRWAIHPDGSWTWARTDKRVGDAPPAPPPPRSGRLTEAQRDELTGLARDPRLIKEMRAWQGHCTSSDGPYESLVVGSVKFVASWCPERRPRIKHLRERIAALTTA
jgi:hypothetical protein